MIEKGRVRTRCYTWLVRDILTGSTMPKYTSLNQRIDAINRKVQGETSCLKGERENIVSGNLVYSQAGEKVLHEVQYCAKVLS